MTQFDNSEEDFNLRDQISIIIKEFNLLLALIKKNILWIFAIHLILFLGIFFYYKTLKPQYKAEKTFIIENGGASGLSALSGLSNMFGLNKPGEGNDKYAEILDSPNFIVNVLLEPDSRQAKKLLIETYIEQNELRKKWANSSDIILNNISNVDFSNAIQKPNDLQKRNVAAQIVAELILKDKEYSYRYDKKTGLFSIAYNSKNAAFSLDFMNATYNQFKKQIINDLYEQSNDNLSITKSKLDSIFRELKKSAYSYANKSDRTLGLISQEDNVPKNESLMKMNSLVTIYGEALKQYETFKFVNQSEKVNFLIITEPLLPLLPIKINWKLYVLISQVITFILLVIYFRVRYYFTKF